MMKRLVCTLGMWLLLSTPVWAQLGTVPYTFTPGTTILSAEVNSNFSTAYSNALNRTGGTMTGTLNTLHVLPIADNTYNLGSAAASYASAWIDGTLTLATGTITTANITTLTVSGVTTLNGDVAIGNAVTDGLTVTSILAGGTPLVFEGATADDFELSFAITDPTTPDKTVTFQNVTGTVYVSSGTDVALADGGTNASLSAVQGGVLYSGASAFAVSAAGSSGQIFQSAGTGTPVWTTATFPATATGTGKVLRADGTNWVASTATFPDTATGTGTILTANGTNWVATTATYPATTTVNQLLYSGTANVVSGLATGNSGVLVTSAGGVPSIATDIPTAVTIGTQYIYRVAGTDVAVADGGTGKSSWVVGDIVHATATGTLAGLANVATGQFLMSGGVGVISAWSGTAPTLVLDSLTVASTATTYPQLVLSNVRDDITAPYFITRKARVGPAAVASGDTLGSNIYQGYVNGNYVTLAGIYVTVGAAPSGDHAQTFVSLVTDNGTTSVERFRLGGTAGDIGINAASKIFLDGVALTGDTYIYESASNNIALVSAGITVSISGGNIIATNAAGAQQLYCPVGSYTPMEVNSADSYKVYMDTSSARFKENITDWKGDARKILSLRPRTFDFPGTHQVGLLDFVAEEVAAIDSTWVRYDATGQPISLDRKAMTAAMVALLQQHDRDLEQLKKQIQVVRMPPEP